MPRRAGPGCNFHWTYDPKVIEDEGRKYLYYGSYGGGIWVQHLSDDGLGAEGKATLVGASGRYEGAEVKRHGAWWYLFASATDCCNGALTGYAVYVGRARSPEGPFLDRLGKDMAKGRAGRTPLLGQNGNRWVGVGHNTVFTDAAGQWWTIYHGIDVNEAFFSAKDRLTRRLALLDRIDWIDGWSLAGGGLAMATQDADLYIDRNTASVLQTTTPGGDYRVEAELKLDAPEDCCATAVQAGFVVMRDDDNYVKLVEMAREGLRQVEFAKEVAPVEQYHPRYGNTVVGTPGAVTWLRLDVHREGGHERYTAYSSQDGRTWVGGGTWTHRLGPDARLGLVAMGGAGRRATFIRVAVGSLSP